MSDSEERRRAYSYSAHEEELFSFDALRGFAQSAVQAEQDLIKSFIEKCASVVTPHCNAEDAVLSQVAEMEHERIRARTSNGRQVLPSPSLR